jgi:hypothetical protein
MAYPRSDIAAEFQRRRALTWQKISRWFVFTITAFTAAIFVVVGASIGKTDSGLLVLIGIALMVPAGVGIIAINMLLSRYYLCPACERIPYAGGNAGGVLIDPDTCPHCGAALK